MRAAPRFFLLTSMLAGAMILVSACVSAGSPPPPRESPAPAAATSTPAAAPAPSGPRPPWAHGKLAASQDGHFLVHADGTPFVWVGDTAWNLLTSLKREDVDRYLDDRRQKGFTAIQVVVLPSLSAGHFNGPNAYGVRPFVDGDPLQPAILPGDTADDPAQYDYWDNVDAFVAAAAARGLYAALLPAWGESVSPPQQDGPPLLDANTAESFGVFLGRRYGSAPNVLWILGGDVPAVVDGRNYVDVWRRFAAGLTEGAGVAPVITYHPLGNSSSGTWLQSEPWLTFNMVQSGHAERDLPTWAQVAEDYARTPTKPTLDAEINYEDQPVGWDPANGYFRDYDVRKQAYRSVFAGAFGVTYGNASVWSMARGPGPGGIERSWIDALNRPGAQQMLYLRQLLESRPILERIPDQSLLTTDAGKGGQHVQATRAADGRYAFVYVPNPNRSISIDTRKLAGSRLTAEWYNPRDGSWTSIGEYEAGGESTFTTPDQGPDWVLVLDAIEP